MRERAKLAALRGALSAALGSRQKRLNGWFRTWWIAATSQTALAMQVRRVIVM